MGQGAMSMTQPAAPVYDRTPTQVTPAMQAAAQGALGQSTMSNPQMMMIAQLLKQSAPQQNQAASPQYVNTNQAYQQYLNQFNQR